MVYLIMGVLGSGKTTVGLKLSERLHCVFHDGDDYHPEANRKKMEKGIPLTDADRKPWIFALRAVIDRELAREENAVIACSALKADYRKALISDPKKIKLVYLKATPEIIMNRVRFRHGHFANPKLIPSQFEALEEPEDAIMVDITLPPDVMIDKILAS